MRTIEFPRMFNTNSTRVIDDHLEATKQSVELLLKSERGELYGDPYYGLMLRHYLFEQNDYVVKDWLIDLIYTQLTLFIPQLHVERKDIEIVPDSTKGRIYLRFRGVDQVDYRVDTFNLLLFDEATDNR